MEKPNCHPDQATDHVALNTFLGLSETLPSLTDQNFGTVILPSSFKILSDSPRGIKEREKPECGGEVLVTLVEFGLGDNTQNGYCDGSRR